MHNRAPPLYMLILNYVTPLYLLAGALLLGLAARTPVELVLLALAWIYLVPPLLCRLTLAAFGRPHGTLTPAHPKFTLWWFLTQLQIPYNRLPWLEELLRLMPGLYNLWLRLWGARISLTAYWSPEAIVADRYLLEVGPGAILGGRSRIGGHVMQVEPDGTMKLIVASVRIDAGAMVGMNAAVGPGCHVHAHETVPAGRLLKPFTTRRGGKSHRPEGGPHFSPGGPGI